MTENTTYNRERIVNLVNKRSREEITDEEFADLQAWLSELADVEVPRKNHVNAKQYLIDRLREHLANHGIREGLIAELGGPFNSFASDFPEFDFEYLSLYPVESRDDVLVADITQCDYVASDRYDAVISVSVMEHVGKPWLAAKQISRILKPGGITFHSVPFSFFYHGAPADFWRCTPDALKLMFSELETVEAEFYGRGRRRDNRGSDACSVDRDGGEQFGVDSFGGWRENWSTIYCGRKDPQYAVDLLATARDQTLNNLVKCGTLAGLSDEAAIALVHAGIRDFQVSIDAELSPTQPGTGIECSIDHLTTIWKMRGRKAPKPNYSRFVQWRIFDGPARIAELGDR